MAKRLPIPRAGYFGKFGGRFIPETLMAPLEELEKAWHKIECDRAFWRQLDDLLKHYVGRPTPLYEAENLSRAIKRGRIFLKREDLCHTGAHKINNALGQVLLAKRLKKSRVIAETGAGQHGVATATAAALLGMSCEVFMGEEDMRRQAPNVERMNILGAIVRPVTTGSKTLKDAMNEALRHWVGHVESTHYVIGSVAGPDPYPTMVRRFQSVIGQEVLRQCKGVTGRKLPECVVACIGGGSNAMGIFHAFVRHAKVRLIGVEAAGLGLHTKAHAATLTKGESGVFHGSHSLYLQDAAGQICETHSISAGLDYPGVGPEVAHLAQAGRLEVVTATDDEAIAGFEMLARQEGIIPALESSHAIGALAKLSSSWGKRASVIVNLSGRGDKDLATYLRRKSEAR